MQALESLREKVPYERLLEIWGRAMQTEWKLAPVWVHGDLAIDNLLFRDEKLYAIIDFGCAAIGDPACDLVPAWTIFDGESQRVFVKQLASLGPEIWFRAQAWALWKALITLSEDPKSNKKQLKIVHRIVEDSVV